MLPFARTMIKAKDIHKNKIENTFGEKGDRKE